MEALLQNLLISLRNQQILKSQINLHSAKLIVADCLGAIVGGMAEPEIRMLAKSKVKTFLRF